MNKINIELKSDEELIRIIETPKGYQSFLVDLATAEIGKRDISKERKEWIAEKIFEEKLFEVVETSPYDPEGYELPHSLILSHKHKMKLFKSAFQAYMERRRISKIGLDGLA